MPLSRGDPGRRAIGRFEPRLEGRDLAFLGFFENHLDEAEDIAERTAKVVTNQAKALVPRAGRTEMGAVTNAGKLKDEPDACDGNLYGPPSVGIGKLAGWLQAPWVVGRPDGGKL